MKKCLIKLFGVLFLLGCSTNNSSNQNEFVRFVNENKIAIKKDGEVIKDKNFILQVPNSLKKEED